MLVRAIKQGYHEGFRERGDVFQAPDGVASPWWVPVEVEPEADAGAVVPTSFSQMNAQNVEEEKSIIARRTRRKE